MNKTSCNAGVALCRAIMNGLGLGGNSIFSLKHVDVLNNITGRQINFKYAGETHVDGDEPHDEHIVSAEAVGGASFRIVYKCDKNKKVTEFHVE